MNLVAPDQLKIDEADGDVILDRNLKTARVNRRKPFSTRQIETLQFGQFTKVVLRQRGLESDDFITALHPISFLGRSPQNFSIMLYGKTPRGVGIELPLNPHASAKAFVGEPHFERRQQIETIASFLGIEFVDETIDRISLPKLANEIPESFDPLTSPIPELPPKTRLGCQQSDQGILISYPSFLFDVLPVIPIAIAYVLPFFAVFVLAWAALKGIQFDVHRINPVYILVVLFAGPALNISYLIVRPVVRRLLPRNTALLRPDEIQLNRARFPFGRRRETVPFSSVISVDRPEPTGTAIFQTKGIRLTLRDANYGFCRALSPEDLAWVLGLVLRHYQKAIKITESP